MAFKSKLTSMLPRKQQFQTRVKLLSGGYSNPTAFPNGEITVFPWDTNVDDWLSERLKKGNQHLVLYDLCGQVCDLNGCPLEQFVIGDVNTVLLISRAIRFNSVVEYQTVCPNCGYTSVETIKVPDELGRVGEKESGYVGYDEIVLPDCQDVVHIRPLLVRDEQFIAERDDLNRKLMTDHILRILKPIVTINDGTPDNLDEALRWFNAISPLDATFLESQERELYPHLETDLPHVCDKCRHQFLHPLDFSREFFRPSLKPGKGVTVPANVQPGGERAKLSNNPQPIAG